MTAADVLIAGGGPVGLSLALALGRKGHQVTVLEAKTGLIDDPRASTVQPPTLEMLAAWGVLEQIRDRARIADRIQYWDWDEASLVAELDYAAISDDTPFPYRFHVSQRDLTQVLLDAAQSLDNVNVVFGHKLTSFEQTGSGVEVAALSGGETKHFRAAYLCGADGAGSTVRQVLGVGFAGETHKDVFLTSEFSIDFLIHFADASPTEGVGLAPIAWLMSAEDWAILMIMPGGVRGVFRLDGSQASVANLVSKAMSARLGKLLGHDPGVMQFTHEAIYVAHQRVAESYVDGRVVLLGDAAHLTLPTGGTAMNTGIHDAWYLADALSNTQDLARWAEDRRVEAAQWVNVHASNSYAVLRASGPWERASRNEYLEWVMADPERIRHHLLRNSMLADRIEGEALVPEYR